MNINKNNSVIILIYVYAVSFTRRLFCQKSCSPLLNGCVKPVPVIIIFFNSSYISSKLCMIVISLNKGGGGGGGVISNIFFLNRNVL